MSQQQRKYFIVGTPLELEHADKAVAAGYQLVGGSLHVVNRLSQAGHSSIAGGSLVSANKREEIVNRVGIAIRDVEEKLAGLECPTALRATATAKLTKAMFTFEGIRVAERVLDGEITRLDRRGNTAPAHLLRENSLRFAPGKAREHARPLRFAHRGQYELDFISPSGRKLSTATSLPRLRVQAKSKPVWLSTLRNRLGDLPFLQQDGRTIRASFPRVTHCKDYFSDVHFESLEDPKLEAILAEVLACISEGFFSYRSGMRKLLRQRGLPERAIFNHVSNEGTAGCASALIETGVACEMSSHGCLVPYGQGPRHDAARALANAIYNNFPGMAQIVPRSPLQARDASASQKIIKTVRLQVMQPKRARSESFQLYYAPNFREWHLAFQGFTIDCFQTFQCIEHIAGIVSSLPGFTMNLRIKTTPLDVASTKTMPVLRGLLPGDVAHLIRPEAGIFDASWGSHSNYLADSDLVVTEGLTAVMFEALELRKPVLLLNADARMVPSLPHRPVSELLNGSPRAAVYAASLADNLPAALDAIRRQHHNAPLVESELQEYVWI